MGFLTILGIAVGLGMDAFAVAIATGIVLQKLTFRHFFRLSFHFGLFQFLMPIIGWLAGITIADEIRVIDHWIAFTLLVIVGGKMIKGSFSKDSSAEEQKDPTRKMSLIVLSLATSIDALTVGLSLGMLEIDILYPSVIIGVVAAGMTILGMAFGSRLGCRIGKRMEFVGGLVLIGIGIKILLSYLMG